MQIENKNLPEEYLLLDFEVSLGGKIHDIGAIRGDKSFRKNGSTKSLESLGQFAEGSLVVVGHNLVNHDLQFLRSAQPENPILDLPAIDTLLLSPLCFPENPYHQLIKDYKLVKDSLNDPVADARLAGELFQDEIHALKKIHATAPTLASVYRECLTGNGIPSDARKGFEVLFSILEVSAIQTDEWKHNVRKLIEKLACKDSIESIFCNDVRPSPTHAYIIAWLLVAGSNSILPRWVRYSYKEISGLLNQLRDHPCNNPDCDYCTTTHNAKTQLKKYFDFDDFRPAPKSPNGGSLQEEITRAGMGKRSSLAILPTGGGKSLCFQVPALARHNRRGLLTIVLSPLQALMRDQVENLRRLTGMHSAIDAIYGLQTMPERGAVYKKLLLGDIAILYASPEQLRNNRFRDAISQREIGCWIFDEAHCLSKWGHDFRPDYTYAGRCIREIAKKQGGIEPPPVACFSATAKEDVKQELLDFFKKELDQELTVFDGGTDRPNLTYNVHIVSEHQKPGTVCELISTKLKDPGDGAAVIFCSTRKKVELLTSILRDKNIPAAAFHAGLENETKTQVLDGFNDGDIQIICATNAFGMGVDKSNIRLVIHHDIPGSLENYIQEAGRAGRDQNPAECVLLYNPGEDGKGGDIDTQFTLDSFGRISQSDVRNILRSIRYCQKKQQGMAKDEEPHVYLSASQILHEIETSFDEEIGSSRKTKVATAIASLENAGYLERNENQNRVFQGTPKVATLADARKMIRNQNLSNTAETAWVDIYQAFLNLPREERPDLEVFIRIPSLAPLVNKRGRGNDAARVVLRILNSMSEIGLIKKDISYTALIRYKVTNSSRQTYSNFIQLERATLGLFRELAPDAQPDEYQKLDVKRIVTRLHQEGFTWCLTGHILKLVSALRLDGLELSDGKGNIVVREMGQGLLSIKLQHGWDHVVELSDKRLGISEAILQCIHEQIPEDAPKSATLSVSFEESDLLKKLGQDMLIRSEISDHHAAIHVGLRYLHESGILQIKGGIALIMQAMRIDLDKESAARRYSEADHKPLSAHYSEKNLQIHVMAEYARLGEKELAQALKFVIDYFALEKAEFIKKHFKGREAILDLATSVESHRRIVEQLNNPHQQSIVTEKITENMLILAGPGSGKTRTVAHRCAYMLREQRVKARKLLVLCYNRSAAITLRRRINALAGNDSRGIVICTFHSLAIRLLGISAAEAFQQGTGNTPNEQSKFDEVIPKATSLLDGSEEIPGMDNEQILQSLIGSWSHILIDEYQDIDQTQYDFVSAIAGRARKNPDAKLSILAVGDDDQNIYEFRGANTKFIRQFEKDYEATSFHLVENYRSSKNIISAANHLIGLNSDRMKTKLPIRINKARENDSPGGIWEELDPVGRGAVQILPTKDIYTQASTVLSEVKRIKNLAGESFSWDDVAILGRERRQLNPVRTILEHSNIPLQWACEKHQFPLSRTREIQAGFDILNKHIASNDGGTGATGDELRELFPDPTSRAMSPWETLFHKLIEEWCCEIGDTAAPLENCIHFLHEALIQMRSEHRHGNGIFVGTVHSAKGLEFKHVIILDGKWEAAPKKIEEERRLYYVGMTRAMENLVILDVKDSNNQFVQMMAKSNGTIYREPVALLEVHPSILSRTYHFLGMGDIYLDLGSRDSSVRQHVSMLKPKDPLFLRTKNDRVLLFNKNNQHVATLSRATSNKWSTRLNSVVEAKVFAIVRRHKTDCLPEYQKNCVPDSWEVPLVEVCCSG